MSAMAYLSLTYWVESPVGKAVATAAAARAAIKAENFIFWMWVGIVRRRGCALRWGLVEWVVSTLYILEKDVPRRQCTQWCPMLFFFLLRKVGGWLRWIFLWLPLGVMQNLGYANLLLVCLDIKRIGCCLWGDCYRQREIEKRKECPSCMKIIVQSCSAETAFR